MATNYLAEAFQQMKLLESETFSFDNDGAAKLSNFMDDDLLTDVEVVIDPEAETEEDLKDSYIGDIILACEVCHSMIYKREEEVTVEKDADMANVGELCPYCYSSDGFKIIGKVAPYEEITVETESGEDVKVEVDGKKVETEADDKDEVKDLDPETEEDREELDESLNEATEPLSVRLKKRLAQMAENLEEDLNIAAKVKHYLNNLSDDELLDNSMNDFVYSLEGEDRKAGRRILEIEDDLECIEAFDAFVNGLDENNPGFEFYFKNFMKKSQNLEENFYAVVEVDGEERRFPFKDRDAARRYIQYVRNGAPEFEGKKIGSMWTESLDSNNRLLKEGRGKNKFTYDEAVNYLESKGISCDPTAAGCGEFVCDLLDEYVDDYNDYDEEIYYKSTLDDIIDRAKDYLENPEEDLDESVTKKNSKQNLKEGMEDISITTETDVIKVKATPREDKEAIVPMQPEEVEEIVEPAAEEVAEIPEEEFVEEPAVDTDVDIEEFDEEGFDELGESYLKKVYENVESYKTTSGSLKNNSICLEGIITFNSGKKAKTNFIFEAKEMTKRGKLKFIGENVNLSKNKKAFTLTGIADNKKLMCESLTYNYLAKDAKNNKAKKLYGTVKR